MRRTSDHDDARAEPSPLPQIGIPPTVVAVASGKGGVGRTHVAVNLACLWQAAGYRILYLDADVALGGADLLLGVATAHTLADVVDGRVSAKQALAATPSGVQLLAASAGRWDLAPLGDERRHALLSAVDELEPDFDAVVIDVPAGLSADALGFCAAATEVVTVVTPEPASVEAVCAWLHALASRTAVGRVRILANRVASASAGEDLFRRVVSRADRRPGVSARIALDFIGALPLDSAVACADLRGEPFCRSAPGSAAALALRGAACALRPRTAHARAADRGGGGLFWRRHVCPSTHDLVSCPQPRPQGV